MQHKTTARRRWNATTTPTTDSTLEATFFKATLNIVAQDAANAVLCVEGLKKIVQSPPKTERERLANEIEILESAVWRLNKFIRNLCCVYGVDADDFPEHLESFDIAG